MYDYRTGLVRFGVRDYDATIGRWLAKDPIGFGGDDGNVYRYSNGDPSNRTDPTGAVSIPLLGWVDVGEDAGQEALSYWAGRIDDEGLSSIQRGEAWVGAFFSALWTPCTSNETLLALGGGYGARVLGPFSPRSVPRVLARLREYVRLDRPHHGKGWHLDGNLPKAIVKWATDAYSKLSRP